MHLDFSPKLVPVHDVDRRRWDDSTLSRLQGDIERIAGAVIPGELLFVRPIRRWPAIGECLGEELEDRPYRLIGGRGLEGAPCDAHGGVAPVETRPADGLSMVHHLVAHLRSRACLLHPRYRWWLHGLLPPLSASR